MTKLVNLQRVNPELSAGGTGGKIFAAMTDYRRLNCKYK